MCTVDVTEKKRKRNGDQFYFLQIASLEDLLPKGCGLPLPLGSPYTSKPGPCPTGIRRRHVGSFT